MIEYGCDQCGLKFATDLEKEVHFADIRHPCLSRFSRENRQLELKHIGKSCDCEVFYHE